MVNYTNGKVYKIEPIIEHAEEDVYFGSTTQRYISQRMETHRSQYKQWKEGKKITYQVFTCLKNTEWKTAEYIY